MAVPRITRRAFVFIALMLNLSIIEVNGKDESNTSPKPISSQSTKEKLKSLANAMKKNKAQADKKFYKEAWKMRGILNKLFPYHGCDLHLGHTSVLDCFASDEAILDIAAYDEIDFAYQLYKKHVSLKEIQKLSYEHFKTKYPFDTPTPEYTRYLIEVGITTP